MTPDPPYVRVTRKIVRDQSIHVGDRVLVALSDLTEAVFPMDMFKPFNRQAGTVENCYATVRGRLPMATVLFDQPVMFRGSPCVRCSFATYALKVLPP